MLNYRIVLKFLSFLLLFNGGFMLLSIPVALYFNEEIVTGIVVACLITLGFGIFGFLSTRKASGKDLRKREGFLVVALGWLSMSVFGSLPYLLTGSIDGVTNAFFETVSGYTTTGATILDDIEAMPKSILLWRSLTQWIGGMGIIVLAVAILPILGISSVQLFSAEAPGLKPDKITPRIADTAKRLWLIYLSLTLLEATLLTTAGMGLFDALNHSLTTISTGGFSTYQGSIAHFDSPFIEYIITLFMFIGGTNFILIYWLLKGQFTKLWENEEYRFYFTSVMAIITVVTIALISKGTYGFEESFRYAAFQVISLISTTGYGSADYTLWGSGLTMLAFLLLFAGGSSGSTSGGVKMIRHLILYKNGAAEMRRQMHPNAIIPIRVNGKALSSGLTSAVLAFIMFYIIVFALGSITLAAMSIDFDTAIGAVATSLGNVGPGIAEVGPSFTFNFLPIGAKWELCLLMIIGRLELFTVLLLFHSILLEGRLMARTLFITIGLSCLTLIMSSCENKDYEPVDAIVVKTQHRHWGRGFFKVEVYYRYSDGKDTITDHTTADGLVSSYSSDFNEGDSLRIGINRADTSDAHIILGRITTSFRENKNLPN